MARVKLTKVRKVFPGGVEALRESDLEIADREFMVLVGPSGCGKSTTLRMVAGLEEATSGTIEIGDRVVNDIPPKDRDIAMVFQNYALYPHMTVYDNMAFGLKLRRYPRQEIDSRVKDAAKILGIEILLDRKPKALSGGQRQRVALGRAIVRKPLVFLLDEPLSNLDAKMRVTMRKELTLLHRRLQTTMIYVTHDQIEAMTLGERICVMSDGRMQQVGPPLEIYDRPVNKFVAGFIGTPPINFFEGTLVEAEGSMYFRTRGMDLRLNDRLAGAVCRHGSPRDVTFGIRPENLRMTQGTGAAEDGHASFVSKVEVVEKLGDAQLIYCRVDGTSFVAKEDSHKAVSAGEEIRFQVTLDRCHIFAGKDEENISL